MTDPNYAYNSCCPGSYTSPATVEPPLRAGQVWRKGVCHWCGRSFHVRVDGAIRLHREKR